MPNYAKVAQVPQTCDGDNAKVLPGLPEDTVRLIYFWFILICLESMLPLLPSGVQSQVHLLVPSRKFDLSYDLNFATICTDFQENIEFQFSLGWKALVHRFLGSVNAQRAFQLMDQNLQLQVRGAYLVPMVGFTR